MDDHPIRCTLDGRVRRRRIAQLYALQDPCRLCPRRCGARRRCGVRGCCGATDRVQVAWAGAHHGEEPPISSAAGVANVFFVGCALGCCFCQNYQISRPAAGRVFATLTVEELAVLFERLQNSGCGCLGVVTGTQFLPQVMEALWWVDERTSEAGLPLVVNSSGYEQVAVLELLEGMVDCYLVDFKFGPGVRSNAFCDVADYFTVAEPALVEMHRQLGPFAVEGPSVAAGGRGVIVRHLVLPAGAADTNGVLETVAMRLRRRVSISLLGQYHPPVAGLRPPLDRALSPPEYAEARRLCLAWGLDHGWFQELESAAVLNPDFTRAHPFGASVGEEELCLRQASKP
jgi:putative pyruvate formate lyase activating enzyme